MAEQYVGNNRSHKLNLGLLKKNYAPLIFDDEGKYKKGRSADLASNDGLRFAEPDILTSDELIVMLAESGINLDKLERLASSRRRSISTREAAIFESQSHLENPLNPLSEQWIYKGLKSQIRVLQDVFIRCNNEKTNGYLLPLLFAVLVEAQALGRARQVAELGELDPPEPQLRYFDSQEVMGPNIMNRYWSIMRSLNRGSERYVLDKVLPSAQLTEMITSIGSQLNPELKRAIETGHTRPIGPRNLDSR